MTRYAFCGSLDFVLIFPHPSCSSSLLSDVVLVSSDGDRFYAHRLLLCGQSPVFHSMMESAIWRDTSSQDSNEVSLLYLFEQNAFILLLVATFVFVSLKHAVQFILSII